MAGVKTESDGFAVVGANTSVRAEQQNLGPDRASGSHPMPTFWLRPKRFPDGHCISISGVVGRLPAGPRACVVTDCSSAASCVSSTEAREGSVN